MYIDEDMPMDCMILWMQHAGNSEGFDEDDIWKWWNKPVNGEKHEDDGTENADNITSQAKASTTFKYYISMSLLRT